MGFELSCVCFLWGGGGEGGFEFICFMVLSGFKIFWYWKNGRNGICSVYGEKKVYVLNWNRRLVLICLKKDDLLYCYLDK